MKIIANNYEAKEIVKMIRECTDLNQTEFGHLLNRSRDSINNIENGRNRMYLNDFIDMCKKFNIKIILEEKNSKNL